MLLPLTLNKFADALILVPARDRAAEARAIIADAGEMAARCTASNAALALNRGDTTYRSFTWGDMVESVCLQRQNAWRVARSVFAAPFAGLTDRDGLQAYEVALEALTDMVREAEAQADRVAA